MNSLNDKRRLILDRRKLRPLIVAVITACVTLVCTSAFGQDATHNNRAVEQKLDDYWSVDRDLPAVKDRLYGRDGRFGLGIYVGMLTSEPFFYYNPVGLRAEYNFNNFMGVELEGSFMGAEGVLSHNTELTDFLESEQPEFDKAVDTEDRFLWHIDAMFVWHPLYGKLALLQRKLAHFDINVSIGAGAVGVERPGEQRLEATTKAVPELALGLGLRFFATNHIVVRLDGRAFAYKGANTPANGDGFFSQLQLPLEFLLGASYMF